MRTSLLISDLRRDDGTQVRVGAMDRRIAGEYAQAIESAEQGGQALPDPIVFQDGKNYWLADGFYRVFAHEILKRKHVTCEVLQGTLRDAILYAVGANSKHGLRRTPADVRQAVFLLISDEEWGKHSNTWIAEHVGITEGRVRQIRKEIREHDRNITGTGEVENFDEKAEVEGLTPERRAAWEAMGPEEQKIIVECSQADSEDEPVRQIEELAKRVLAKLADVDEAKTFRAGLRCYVDQLRLAVGWERTPKVRMTEDLLGEIKPLLDQMRRKHAGLLGERVLTKKLESLWDQALKHAQSATA
jgi:hypothetical protein